ncbi:MAG: tripartite tricarboxylate transporter substrate binding protein [Variibacter sp.]|nr:tripartite tricarboxylate transporter substrate binding protein [Variibacter sp.]
MLVRPLLLLGALLASCCTDAWAQPYPSRLVRLIVPFAAGAPDSVARIVATQLQIQLGQSVIVENRPAANGTVATEAVAKAPADGYTLLVTSAAFAVNPSIYRKLPYDVLSDFEAVAAICRSDGSILAANPALPARTVQELIALAKRPGMQLSYGSAGVGNTTHLAAELFKSRTGVEMVHVPYRGAGPALTDLIGGQIQVMFVSPPLAVGHIQSGKLRGLAFTGPTRLALIPDVPTLAESGIENFGLDGGWFGMFAPAKTPPEVVERIDREVKAALTVREVRDNLAAIGLLPMEQNAAAFKAFVAEQVRMFAELVKIAKIEPQ